MTVPLPSDDGGRIRVNMTDLANLTDLGTSATCVACGPGLGQSVDLVAFVCVAYQTFAQPMVLDADALNSLARTEKGWVGAPNAPRILTPHPREFARLIAVDGFAAAPRGEQIAKARLFARSEGVVVVLKGHQTFITDGVDEAINATGNPGMATGGTGDVLTGVITALVCQGLSPFDAAVLGAHVHGLAGDLAAAELGQVSLIASDLLRYLPKAFQAGERGA
jgi:NAD(P)H-hydrate epimerase